MPQEIINSVIIWFIIGTLSIVVTSIWFCIKLYFNYLNFKTQTKAEFEHIRLKITEIELNIKEKDEKAVNNLQNLSRALEKKHDITDKKLTELAERTYANQEKLTELVQNLVVQQAILVKVQEQQSKSIDFILNKHQ